MFFALWPDAGQRADLAQAIRKALRSCGGRPVAPESLHVTLAFLGSVPGSRVPELGRIARAIAASFPPVDGRLRLRFERLVHWKRAQILCALAGAADDTAADAENAVARNTAWPEASAAVGAPALAAALVEQTALAGFTPDLKPFRAHVTVARKVVHPPARHERFALQWDFGAFALIDSRTEPAGPVYSVIESYLLVSGEKAHE